MATVYALLRPRFSANQGEFVRGHMQGSKLQASGAQSSYLENGTKPQYFANRRKVIGVVLGVAKVISFQGLALR